jgi:hypothetical protein
VRRANLLDMSNHRMARTAKKAILSRKLNAIENTSLSSSRTPMADGQLLSREETASLAGRSVRTVRRWEADGKLVPAISEDGKRLHSLDSVKHVLQVTERRGPQRDDAYDAATGKKAFALLRQGVPIDELVEHLDVHPRAAIAIARDFAEARGTFFLTGKDTFALCAAYGLSTDSEQARNAQKLIDWLVGATDGMMPCSHGCGRPGNVCSDARCQGARKQSRSSR